MSDRYGWIIRATPERLAEMIKEHNRWRRGEGKYSEAGAEPPFRPDELGVLLDEAAERLGNRKRERFNSESFDI